MAYFHAKGHGVERKFSAPTEVVARRVMTEELALLSGVSVRDIKLDFVTEIEHPDPPVSKHISKRIRDGDKK